MKFTIGTTDINVVLQLNKNEAKEFGTQICGLKHECYTLASPGDLISISSIAKPEEDVDEFIDLLVDGILRSTSSIKKGGSASRKKRETSLNTGLFYRFEASKKKGLRLSTLEVLELRRPTEGVTNGESMAVGTVEVQIWRKYPNDSSSESSIPANVRAPTYEQVPRWVDFGKSLVRDVPQDYEIGMCKDGGFNTGTLKTRLAEDREGFRHCGSAIFHLVSQASLEELGFELVKNEGVNNKASRAMSTATSPEIIQEATSSAKGKSTVIFTNSPTLKKKKYSKKSVASASKDGSGLVKKKSQPAPEIVDMAGPSASMSDAIDEAQSTRPADNFAKGKQVITVAPEEIDTPTTASQLVIETPSESFLEKVVVSKMGTDISAQVQETGNSAGTAVAGNILDDASFPTMKIRTQSRVEAISEQPLAKDSSMNDVVGGDYSQVIDDLSKENQTTGEPSLYSQFPLIGEGVEKVDYAQKTQQKKLTYSLEGVKGGPANQDRALRDAKRQADQIYMSSINYSMGANVSGLSLLMGAPAMPSPQSLPYEPLTPPASAMKNAQASSTKVISSPIPFSLARQSSPETPDTNSYQSRAISPCQSDVEEVEPQVIKPAEQHTFPVPHQSTQIIPSQTKAEFSIMRARRPSSVGLGLGFESLDRLSSNNPQLVKSTEWYEESMNNLPRFQHFDGLPATNTDKTMKEGPHRGMYGSGRPKSLSLTSLDQQPPNCAWKNASPAPIASRDRGDVARQPEVTRRASISSQFNGFASVNEALKASTTDDAVRSVLNIPLPTSATVIASPSQVFSFPDKPTSAQLSRPSPLGLSPPVVAHAASPHAPCILKRRIQVMNEASIEPEQQRPRKVSFAPNEKDIRRRLQEAEARVNRLKEENERLIEQEQIMTRLKELECEAERFVQDNARRQANLNALGEY